MSLRGREEEGREGDKAKDTKCEREMCVCVPGEREKELMQIRKYRYRNTNSHTGTRCRVLGFPFI
jgi:hypothetical protein